jgi:hypothetical protein
MKKTLLGLATLAVYLLHQDFWFWSQARPLVFGFLPIGLFYHAVYCVLASLVLWLLVRHAWPTELERAVEREVERHEDRLS